MTKHIPGQREHGARVGGMGQQLRGIIGRESSKLHLMGCVHSGIHKNHGVHHRDRSGVFGRELLTDQRLHPRQTQRAHGFCDARTNAVVAAQRVAVADDEEIVDFHSFAS